MNATAPDRIFNGSRTFDGKMTAVRPTRAAYFWTACVACAVSLGLQVGSLAVQHEGRLLGMLRIGAHYGAIAGLSPAEMEHAVNDSGFDGQFFFYLARDPRVGESTQRALDAPRLRARRIGFPLLGFLLGLGSSGAAAGLFVAEALAGLGLIALAQSGAHRSGASPLWCLAIPTCLPFALSSGLLTAELPAAFFLVAAAESAARGRNGSAWLLLAAAAVTKEVSVLAPLAFAATEWRRSRPAAMRWATSLAPFLAWETYLQSRVPEGGLRPLLSDLTYPGEGLYRALAHHLAGALADPLEPKTLGLLAATLWYLGGAAGAVLLCVRRRTPARVLGAAASLLVLLLGFDGAPQALNEVFNFGRQLFLLPVAAVIVLFQERGATSKVEAIGVGSWLCLGAVLGTAWAVQEIAGG